MIPADKLFSFSPEEDAQYTLQLSLQLNRLLGAPDLLDLYSCHSQPHVLEVMEQCSMLLDALLPWLQEKIPGTSRAWMHDHLLLSAKLHDIGMCGTASLRTLLKATDKGFSETLLDLIANSGKKDSQIYNRANVSRQHFSKIRSNPNYRPTKATAIAFAIALELDLDQARDLIGRAGYALTNSSKFDVIIMYFIRNRIYDLFVINDTLYEFDQNLLGG